MILQHSRVDSQANANAYVIGNKRYMEAAIGVYPELGLFRVDDCGCGGCKNSCYAQQRILHITERNVDDVIGL
jgi:hypothetical protein